MTNQSNVEVIEIVFAPVNGHYSNTNSADYNTDTKSYPPDVSAPAQPAHVKVSLQPNVEQTHFVQTCTDTPPPENPNYEYTASYPSSFSWVWANGQRGSGSTG